MCEKYYTLSVQASPPIAIGSILPVDNATAQAEHFKYDFIVLIYQNMIDG